MDNPFFKNNGPFKLKDILRDIGLENDQNNQDQNIIDIKDLQNSKLNEITFFHSKKYKTTANNTRASFCITTKSLKNELPKSCLPIIVNNVLVSTSVITAKFYPDSINDDFDNSTTYVDETNFKDKVIYGKNVLIGKNVSIGTNCKIGHNSIIEKNVFHIRFHLMPEISTTITENKKNIIIKTKKNNMWMFKSNKEIVIEKSIFVRNDIANETTQIVISGITSALKTKVEWSIEKI